VLLINRESWLSSVLTTLPDNDDAQETA